MFLMYLNILFYYYVLLPLTIDHCYMYVLLLHTPSHVWPEFNKLLSIVYCLLANTLFLGHENKYRLYFLTRLSKYFNGAQKCTVDRPDHWWQTTIKWWITDARSTAFTCYTACTYTCSTAECGIGWSRFTSHSGNTIHLEMGIARPMRISR